MKGEKAFKIPSFYSAPPQKFWMARTDLYWILVRLCLRPLRNWFRTISPYCNWTLGENYSHRYPRVLIVPYKILGESLLINGVIKAIMLFSSLSKTDLDPSVRIAMAVSPANCSFYWELCRAAWMYGMNNGSKNLTLRWVRIWNKCSSAAALMSSYNLSSSLSSLDHFSISRIFSDNIFM